MSGKLTRSFVAALIALVVILGGADVLARLRTQARFAALLDAHPDLLVGDVETSPLAQTVVLHRIALEGGRLVIGTLRLGPAGPPFGPASAAAETAAPAGTIQAEDVAITVGTATIRIKRIDLAGTKLTDADLEAMLDAKVPDSLEARLRKLTATAVVIPEITLDDPTHGAERHAVVKKVLLAGVAEGRASAFSVAETSLALTSGEDAVNATTAGIEAANVDLAQFARVIGTRRTEADEPVRPLFEKVAIESPKLANVTRYATVSAARIAATGVGARPLDQSLAAASAVAAQAGSSAASNALLLEDVTQSVAVKTLDMDDAASRTTDGGEDFQLAAAHIGLRDLGAGGIGAVEMRDVRLEGKRARLAVGTVSMGPVPAPAKTGSGDARRGTRPGQIDLGQVEVVITPRDTQAVRFKVEHAGLAQEGGATAIPATGSATIDKLTFEAAPDGAMRTLYDMGYRSVSLSAAFTSTYDAGARELTIRKLSVNEPTMGSSAIELRLAGVSDDLLSPNAETAQAAALGVVAKALDLKVVDAGLTDKAIALLAKRDGIGVAEERAYYADLFADKLPTMFGDGAGVRAIGAALAKFVAAPRSLHVSIASKDGLGVGAIGMLGDPGALLDSLDVKASANE